MGQTGINTREVITEILMDLSAGKEYSHVLLGRVLAKYDYLDGKEKAFIKRVTEGSLERRLTIDYYLDAFSKTPVKKMKPFIRELLRMSVYQILYMSRVPDRAAINEAVKLAKKKGFVGLSGFVNGVLRSISREGADYPMPDEKKEPLRYLSVKYSMPEWIVEKLNADFGKEKTARILEGLLAVRPVTIRFQRFVTKEEQKEILSQMEETGVTIESHPYIEEAYLLSNAEGIASLPGFQEGLFTVQDLSSMLAVEAAGIRPGDYVVDVCAAPGGKTAYAAMLAGKNGHVESCDVSEYKTAMIEENCQRLQLSNVMVLVRDAREKMADTDKPADVVIADVPCLGLGVMGHKRDIKYRVQKEDLESLTALQKEIVTAAAGRVRPGGVLLYSTCSMTREENADMVRFMEDNLGLSAESMEDVLPKSFLQCLTDEADKESISKGSLQLFPGIHETDGFFFARMRK